MSRTIQYRQRIDEIRELMRQDEVVAEWLACLTDETSRNSDPGGGASANNASASDASASNAKGAGHRRAASPKAGTLKRSRKDVAEERHLTHASHFGGRSREHTKEAITSTSQYLPWMLTVLSSNGGIMRAAELQSKAFAMLENHGLNHAADKAVIGSKRIPRWATITGQAKNVMEKKGWVVRGDSRGAVVITDAGRAAAAELPPLDEMVLQHRQGITRKGSQILMQ